jgi:RND family efflux transporter MFP subunit
MISRTLYAPCRLEAGSEAVVSVSVPSVVEEVLVQAGDTVTAGERLLVMRTDDVQRASVFAASAVLEAARASSEYAGANLSRAAELFENGAMSPQEYQRAETGALASEASHMQALAGYSAAVSSAGSGYVTAPFRGTVGRVMVTQGNMASGPLLSIFSGDVRKAELLVAPRHMPFLRPGLPAVFMTDHFPGELFPGTVTAVSSSADPVSGLVSLSVQFFDSSGVLVPGLSGLVMVSLESRDSVLVLGETSLTPKGECCWEAAVVRNGTAQLTEIRTGISNGNRYEVTEGLFPGDTVVTLGHTLVSDGQPVRVL